MLKRIWEVLKAPWVWTWFVLDALRVVTFYGMGLVLGGMVLAIPVIAVLEGDLEWTMLLLTFLGLGILAFSGGMLVFKYRLARDAVKENLDAMHAYIWASFVMDLPYMTPALGALLIALAMGLGSP